MAIDSEIDLTIDFKFAERTSPKTILGLSRAPWGNIISSWDRHNRSYGDRISDDVGITVRRCSDGKWWFIGDIKNMPYIYDAFNDYLFEDRGGMEGDLLQRCLRCGKLIFSKTSYILCDDCSPIRGSKAMSRFFPTKPQIPTPKRDTRMARDLFNILWKSDNMEDW